MDANQFSIIFTVLILSLFGCNADKEWNIDAADLNFQSERYFPVEMQTEKFDTLLAGRQVRLIIYRTNLETYVSREYEIDDKTQIDKYSDAEISLMISRNSEILLDTFLGKEQFLEYADKNFIDSSVFHNYWFKKFDNDRLEFIGSISIPETDIGFGHYFDLNSNQLNFELLTDDEE